MTRLFQCSCPFNVFLVLLAFSAGGAEPDTTGVDHVFRAGAATSNITPMLGGEIMGNFVTPPATRIHDELHARCLVLDDGRTRLVFVVCDNVGIARDVFDEAKRLVHEATGLPVDHMLMASTHTHSATAARPLNYLKPSAPFTEYQTFLARRIADGVRRAINNLEPARIAWGSADEPRPLFNRRYKLKPGVELLNPLGGVDRAKTNPGGDNPNVLGPAGPTDPQVSFISVQAKDRRPIALLANYSLHYVGGMRPDEISADYFAVFADRIQQRLGADRLDPPFVGILSNGTSGDVNNINIAATALKQKPRPYEQMSRVADMVADAVFKAHASVQFHDWVPLRAVARELTLKVRKPTPEAVDRASKLSAGAIKPASQLDTIYAERTMQLVDSPEEISVPLQAFAIGDLGVAAVPFEVFSETGLEIKARSPIKPVFTIELANGSYGYLPTPEQHRLGGYETWLGTNRVEVEASRKIVAALLPMLAELKQESAAGGVSQTLVLPPGQDNPRNSEGDFIYLGDGRVLFVYTHFTGGAGDEASAYLASRSSADGGKTWDATDRVVVEKPKGVQNVMSVSLLRLADGRIAMFYLVKKSNSDCRAVMRVSADGAKTWGEPTLCMPDEGYFVVNNGRAVQLASGRILLPAGKHDWVSGKPGAKRGVAVCFFSDDGGATWRQSKSALEAPPESRAGLQEPLVVELKGGRLMMLSRTDRGSQFRSYSEDGGDTWSEAVASDLASPLSPASVKRIPGTGDLLMVWNDHAGVAPALKGKRTPLTAAISKDEGKTWEHRKTLYDDPDGWYCYTAIDFVGDRVLLGHCAGKQTKGSSGLATTVVTSFEVAWLYR